MKHHQRIKTKRQKVRAKRKHFLKRGNKTEKVKRDLPKSE